MACFGINLVLMFVLPKDNNTNGVSSKVFKFWTKGGTNYTLIIGVMPSDTAAASFVGVDTISVPAEYTLYTIDFSSYAGSDKYVAIKHGMNSTYDSYYIDDVDYFEPFQNDITALNNVNVSIYPNPNNGQFTLSVNGAEGNMNMEIVNLAGQVVYTQRIEATSNFTTDIDVSEFATGVYYIKLSNNDGVKVNKLIIK